jgi:hypothetical protein
MIIHLRSCKGNGEETDPFASITWSRFDGSAALPHSTLSLRVPHGGTAGWLPCNDVTLDRALVVVKRAPRPEARDSSLSSAFLSGMFPARPR